EGSDNKEIESNARLVEWADGSLTLMVGEESFKVLKRDERVYIYDKGGPNPPGFTTNGVPVLGAVNDMSCHGLCTSQLTVTPGSLESRTHKNLARWVIRPHGESLKGQKKKTSLTTTDEVLAAQAKAEQSLEDSRFALSAGSRMKDMLGRRGMSEAFLESGMGSASPSGARGIHSLKQQYKKRRRTMKDTEPDVERCDPQLVRTMLSVAELERIQRSRKVKEQWPLHLAITMLLLLPVIALIVAASEEQSICRREETVCSNACTRRWEELVNTLTEEERIDIENGKEEYSTRCQGECDTAFAECSEKPLILYIGVAVLGICTLCTCLLSSLAAALRHKEEVERITRHLEGGEESEDDHDEMLSYPREQDTDGNIITTSSASPAPVISSSSFPHPDVSVVGAGY
ncbi:Paf1 complex component, partial [Perkinsus olseni]